MMMPQNILVVFSDDTDIWWLKVLRRGYRHCFVMVDTIAGWVSIDPLLRQTEIIGLGNIDHDVLTEWLISEGYTVIGATIRPLEKHVLPIPAISCVGHIKRILGITTLKVLTPWQLYNYLLKP